MTRRVHLGSFVASLGLLFATAPAAFGADQAVTATGANTFTPQTVSVTEGEQVTWTNTGGYHNVHFDDESFVQPPGVQLDPWTVSRTFNAVGSFSYYCDAHLAVGMAGTVNVLAAASGATGTDTPAGGTPTGGQGTHGGSPPRCASKREFPIRLRGIDSRRVRSAVVSLNGKELPVRKEAIDGRLRHTTRIDLRGLPRGTYNVTITVTTESGRVLRGVRTYRTCADKLTSSKLPRL
jgi:plastocyanin